MPGNVGAPDPTGPPACESGGFSLAVANRSNKETCLGPGFGIDRPVSGRALRHPSSVLSVQCSTVNVLCVAFADFKVQFVGESARPHLHPAPSCAMKKKPSPRDEARNWSLGPEVS